MPLTYNEVYDLYRGVSPALPKGTSLPKFARLANELTGSDEFSMGEVNTPVSLLNKANYWIGRGTEAVGADALSGQLMSKAYELFGGSPEAGYETGKHLPKAVVQMLPMMAGPAGVAASSALMGADAYGETGSVAQGALSAAMPKIMGVAGDMGSKVARSLGFLRPVSRTVPEVLGNGIATGRNLEQQVLEGFGQKLIHGTSHLIGGVAGMDAIRYGVDAIEQGTATPYEQVPWTDFVLNKTVGQLPWMIPSVKRAFGKGGQVIESKPLSESRPEIPREVVLPEVSDYDSRMASLMLADSTGRTAAMAHADPAKRSAAIKAHEDAMLVKGMAMGVMYGPPAPPAGAAGGAPATPTPGGPAPVAAPVATPAPVAGVPPVSGPAPASAAPSPAPKPGSPPMPGPPPGAATPPAGFPTTPTPAPGMPPSRAFTMWGNADSEVAPALTAKDRMKAAIKARDAAPTPEQKAVHQAEFDTAMADLKAGFAAVKPVKPEDVKTPEGVAKAVGKAAVVAETSGSRAPDPEIIREVAEVLVKQGATTQEAAAAATAGHANEIIEEAQTAGAKAGRAWEELGKAGKLTPLESTAVREQISAPSNENAKPVAQLLSGWANWRARHGIPEGGEYTSEQIQELRNVLAGIASTDPDAPRQIIGAALRSVDKKAAKGSSRKAFDTFVKADEEAMRLDQHIEPESGVLGYVTKRDHRTGKYHVHPVYKTKMDRAIQEHGGPAADETRAHEDPDDQLGAMTSDEFNLLRERGTYEGWNPEDLISLGGQRFKIGASPFQFRFQRAVQNAGKGPVLNVMPDKHGLVGSNRLLKAAGAQFGRFELDVLDSVVKSLERDGRVDPQAVAKAIGEAEHLQVHRYGQFDSNETEERLHELAHTFDSMSNVQYDNNSARIEGAVRPEIQALVDEFNELAKVRGHEDGRGPRATSSYNTVSPLDTKKHPVIRIDVALPVKTRDYRKLTGGDDAFESRPQWQIDEDNARESKAGLLWSQDNLHENLPNTLGWAMVQETQLNGERVWVVGEMQSRWGQHISKAEPEVLDSLKNSKLELSKVSSLIDKLAQNDPARTELLIRETRLKADVVRDEKFIRHLPKHPLLSSWETLTLKAVIDEARKAGVQKIVLSDGETAMMTEGHDKQRLTASTETNKKLASALRAQDVGSFKGLTGSEEFVLRKKLARVNIGYEPEGLTQKELTWLKVKGWEAGEIPQAGGMRAQYDQRSPDILRKLTGSTGEVVDLGVHKNAKPQEANGEFGLGGSPVFRNADGTPKTNITGKLYDLTKVHAEIEREGAQLLAQKGVAGAATPTSSTVEHVAPPVTFDEFTQHLLRKTGLTPEQRLGLVPYFQAVKGMFPVDSVRWGEVVNDVQGQEFLGMASARSARLHQVFLAAREKGTPDEVREMGATMAHELIGHISDNMVGKNMLPAHVEQSLLQFRTFLDANPVEGLEFVKLMRDTLPKQYKELGLWDKVLNADDANNTSGEELYANAAAMWAMSKMGSADAHMMSLLAPPEARSWLKNVGGFARKILGAVKSWLNETPNQGSEMFTGGTRGVVEMFDRMSKAIQRGEHDMSQLDKMLSADGLGFTTLRTSTLQTLQDPSVDPAIRELAALATHRYGPLSRRDKAVEQIANWTQSMQGLGDMTPDFKGITASVAKHGPKMNALKTIAMEPLLGDRDSLTGTISARGPKYKQYKMLDQANDAKLNVLFSDLQQFAQRYKGKNADGTPRVFDYDAIKEVKPTWPPGGTGQRDLHAELMNLTPHKREAVLNGLARHQESNMRIAQQTAESFKERNIYTLATYLSRYSSFEQAPDMARKFFSAFEQASSTDPQMKLLGDQQLAGLRSLIGKDEVFMRSLDLIQKSNASRDALEGFFRDNPNHASLIRVGKWHVTAFDSAGVEHADNLASLDDYGQWKQNMQAQGFKTFGKPIESKAQSKFQLSDESLEVIKSIEEKHSEVIKQLGLEPEIESMLLQSTDVAGEVARVMNTMDNTIPGFIKGVDGGSRKRTAGSMDMVATHQVYAALAARLNASRMMKAEVSYHLTNSKLREYPHKVEQFKQMLENYMRPDSNLGQFISKANAVYFLGLNVPTHLNNMLQSWVTTAPELIARGASPMQAMRLVNGAAKDMGKFSLRAMAGKLGMGDESSAINKLVDKEEQLLFKHLIDEGIMSFGAITEAQDTNVQPAIDFRHVADKGVVEKLYDSVKRPLRAYADTTMKLFGATEHFNVRLAALAGLRLVREQQGKNYDRAKAFEQVIDFVRSSTFQGGRVNRPATPFEGRFRLLGHLAYSLQTYTLGWLNNAARYIQHWRGAEYLDLTPKQRTDARNAALTMFGVQIAAAGALGLPFMTAGLKLLEKATGLDIIGRAHVALSDLLKEDEENGGGLTDLVMNGAANSALATAGLPADMSSRFAIGGILGVNSFEGFSGDAVFGPTGGMVSSVMAGLKSAAQGNMAKGAQQLSPPAFKKLIGYWMNGGDIQTSGGLKIDTEDGDRAAYLLGFTPQKLKKIQQFEQYSRQRGVEDMLRHKREAGEILELITDDPEDAQRKIAEISRDENVPVRTVALRVARHSAEKEFPLDVRQGVSRQNAEYLMQLAQTLGVSVPEAQETAKASHISEVMSMLGERGIRPTRRAMEADSMGQDMTAFSTLGRQPHGVPGF